MRKLFIFFGICFLFTIVVFLYYYNRWSPIWEMEKPHADYQISHHSDDTIRVIMIGDSWAGMHTDYDNGLQMQLQKLLPRPVAFESKGKGGEKTKGIYRLLFEDSIYGFRPLISQSPDYCIISAIHTPL